MSAELLIIIIFISAAVAAVVFARRDAKRAERLAALKAELLRRAREQERINAIKDNVSRMSDADVRERLRNVSGK